LECVLKKKKKKNSAALSPRANYTNWATANCRQNLVPTFVDRGVSRGQSGGSLTVVNLSFLDWRTTENMTKECVFIKFKYHMIF
jgi:hypothetical protein